MKKKYELLDKSKRKEIKSKYYDTSSGKYVKRKLISALICGVLCILISIYLFLSTKNLKVIDYIYNTFICICGIVFIIMAKKIEIKKINEYVIKHKI